MVQLLLPLIKTNRHTQSSRQRRPTPPRKNSSVIGIACNHKPRSIVFAALVLIFLLGFQSTHASGPTKEMLQTVEMGRRNEDAVLNYLVPALRNAGKVGRIYYEASCPSDQYFLDPFPKLNAQPPSKDVSGLAAVREIFRGDTNVEVEETPIGIIRVRIGKVSDELLRTIISRITLKPDDQYNGMWAVNAIESSEEVLAARHKLGIHGDSLPHSWLGVEPANGLPHLPDSITNTTLDQA